MFNTPTLSWSSVLLDSRRSPIRCQVHSSQPKTKADKWITAETTIFLCSFESLRCTPLTVAQVDCYSFWQTLSCMHVTVATLTVTLCKKADGDILHETVWDKTLYTSALILDQLETVQCTFKIHRWYPGLRPAHLSCGLSCMWLMVLAAVWVYRLGLGGDVSRFSVESLWPQGHSSPQMLLWHHEHYCGGGCGNTSTEFNLFLWESLMCIDIKCSGDVFCLECKRTFEMWYDRQMTYSGSRKGCSPSVLGGSARSNDLQLQGGMDSCGWGDGRWNA